MNPVMSSFLDGSSKIEPIVPLLFIVFLMFLAMGGFSDS